jgi:hypothetical protein
VYFHSAASRAYFNVRDYKKAIETATEAIKQKQRLPHISHLVLVASHSLLGQQEKSRAAAAELLKVDPNFTLTGFKKRLSYLSDHPKHRANIDRLIDVARNTGLE